MARKTRIIIIIISLIAVGLIGCSLWFFKGGQKVKWTTPAGQEIMLQIPKIPGAKLISESKENCFYKANYLHTLYKEKDLSSYIIQATKEVLLEQGFKLEKEDDTILEASKETDGIKETIILKTNYDQTQGTFISLEFNWSPCQQ